MFYFLLILQKKNFIIFFLNIVIIDFIFKFMRN